MTVYSEPSKLVEMVVMMGIEDGSGDKIETKRRKERKKKERKRKVRGGGVRVVFILV